MGTTQEARMIATGGRSSGFDYLRVILATAVVFWHAFTIIHERTFNDSVLATPWRGLVMFILPMFFALSGFLVAGSLFRNSISGFVGLRVIRIYPALAVEVLLSAFILGPLLTSFPLSHYFGAKIFSRYLLNMLGWIHYSLPGVFLTNPTPNVVNGQLWTVPWELWCYLSLTVLALLRITKSRVLFLAVTVAATVVVYGIQLYLHHGQWDHTGGMAGETLPLSFLYAVAVYLYRDKLPWNGWLFVASLVVMGLVFEVVPAGDYLAGPAAAYATIYLGLLNPKKIWILRGADYSYGLYIYHFAIQQALIFLLPGGRQWYIIFPLSFVLTAAFAAFSWHLVEKPALGARKWLLPWLDDRLARAGAIFSGALKPASRPSS